MNNIIWFDIIIIVALLGAFIGYFLAWIRIRGERRDAVKTSRDIIKGQVSEQIAPLLPNFPSDLNIADARFMGKPIDFIVFKGISENNISEVVFLEVKNKRMNMNENERSLKEAIENKKVRWVPFVINKNE
jgi:predicted Holliday junction resolvase-like endonuclease